MEDSTELEFSNSAVQFGNTNNDFYVLSESEVHKVSVQGGWNYAARIYAAELELRCRIGIMLQLNF